MQIETFLFFAKILVPFLVIFNLLPLLIWLERKVSAYVQDRHGPNRAEILGIRLGGLLHTIADVLKLLTKHDIIPHHVNKPLFVLAPFIALFVASVTFVVIPFADSISVSGKEMALQAAPAPIGLLYILAMTSIGVYGIMLAGWASHNKYALLGGLRSSAQLVSYEIGMGLSLLGVFMLSGSVEIGEIIRDQSHLPWQWNAARQPLACLLFIVCAFAETNRNPFDLPEGESEIVAGYHVEYSSMKFAMFFMGEYANMIIASALIAALFFGGWQVPFLSTEILRAYAGAGSYGLLIAIGATSAVIGALLIRAYAPKRYGDLRDYEVLVFGVPALLIGVAAVAAALIFGPFELGDLGRQVFAALVQATVFIAKILGFCFFFILVRWTLPRFRYDQLMNLGWKGVIPLGMGNTAATAVVLYLLHRR